MGKSVGFIGNFKGKLGNTVGYKVSQSNSGTNQGVRVYQPNIKNPKSAAQAEQRAKYAPIFATYRALKSIIDRGNESKPYGNASRIAWLKKAFRATEMPWYPKGALIDYPVGCQLTHGRLRQIPFSIGTDAFTIYATSSTQGQSLRTVGAVSQVLLDSFPFLKEGDQVTFVSSLVPDTSLGFNVMSIIIDDTDPVMIEGFSALDGYIMLQQDDSIISGAIIVSREGANGEHLRSTSSLYIDSNQLAEYPYRTQDKQAAIESYMATGTTDADWAEESIQ